MPTESRQTIPLMRFALLLGAILTFLSGVQLFVLTDRTERFFAWTVGSGATATIIGAFYWTACVLAYLSWRRQPWVRARVGVPGVTLFLWATLLSTLLHTENFHFGSDVTSARLAAWAWLIVYVVDPILVTLALVLQRREPGTDPPRFGYLSSSYRRVLNVVGPAFALLGVGMVAMPSAVVDTAPFPLTPLTSRTIGAWVIAMGVVFVTMAWENDRDRIRPAAIASVVAPALLIIGTLRYLDQFTWGAPGWAYVIMITLILGIGVWGLIGGIPREGGRGS